MSVECRSALCVDEISTALDSAVEGVAGMVATAADKSDTLSDYVLAFLFAQMPYEMEIS
jgi:hypothetical protein